MINKALSDQVRERADLLTLPGSNGRLLSEKLGDLSAAVGEQIELTNYIYFSGQVVETYVHTGSKLGSIVVLKGGATQQVARDMAIQVVVGDPIGINETSISSDLLAKEREVALAQLQGGNKPEEVVKKIIEGKIKR